MYECECQQQVDAVAKEAKAGREQMTAVCSFTSIRMAFNLNDPEGLMQLKKDQVFYLTDHCTSQSEGCHICIHLAADCKVCEMVQAPQV